jgi:hypothetical protein
MLGQTAEKARANGREERRFWAWSEDDYTIREVTAFAGPNTDADGYWWVPELGYSLSSSHHLFSTKYLAADHAYRKITKEIDRLLALREHIDANDTAAPAAAPGGRDE